MTEFEVPLNPWQDLRSCTCSCPVSSRHGQTPLAGGPLPGRGVRPASVSQDYLEWRRVLSGCSGHLHPATRYAPHLMGNYSSVMNGVLYESTRIWLLYKPFAVLQPLHVYWLSLIYCFSSSDAPCKACGRAIRVGGHSWGLPCRAMGLHMWWPVGWQWCWGGVSTAGTEVHPQILMYIFTLMPTDS